MGRNYSATLNNPLITGEEFLDAVGKLEPLYAICQLEKGETPHLQCCFGFKKPQRFLSMVKKIQQIHKGAHVELSKNAMAAYNYCKKEESRLEGPWHTGVPPAAKNVAGDTKTRNALILEYGPVKALDEGLIALS